MAYPPTATEEQSQGQVPSTQTNIIEIPILQTPANEEGINKKDREEETPPRTSTNQQGEERQRLNPFSEEQMREGLL